MLAHGAGADGVPHIALASFASGQFDVAAFDRVLERYRDAPALILDVRMNGGGNDAAGAAGGGALHHGASHHRMGAVSAAARGTMPLPRSPSGACRRAGRGSIRVPVLLLTGRQTWSSAEGFVSAMRELPNVVVVGDTTGGGSGNPSVFSLREGYGFSVVAVGSSTPADRSPIEWRGIAPDVAVPLHRCGAGGLGTTRRWPLHAAPRRAPARSPRSWS